MTSCFDILRAVTLKCCIMQYTNLKSLSFAGLFLLVGLSAPAQTGTVRVDIANVQQDVAALAQQMKVLRLEMEAMQRENQRLRSQFQAAQSNSVLQNQMASLSQAVAKLRKEYQAADRVQREQIIADVTRQIEALGTETNQVLQALNQSIAAEPSISLPQQFSEEYPKTGVSYEVRSGDTLSGIARAQGSKIKWIQNANKIANPARDLQVGQTIFIPLKK